MGIFTVWLFPSIEFCHSHLIFLWFVNFHTNFRLTVLHRASNNIDSTKILGKLEKRANFLKKIRYLESFTTVHWGAFNWLAAVISPVFSSLSTSSKHPCSNIHLGNFSIFTFKPFAKPDNMLRNTYLLLPPCHYFSIRHVLTFLIILDIS